MKTPLRQILWSGIILPCICACSRTYTPPDAPISEVPFTQVHLEDSFWTPRIETNREVSIPSAFKECEKNGRFDNFAIAGGLKKGEHRGDFSFDDTDPYKIIEGASYSLAVKYDKAKTAGLLEEIYGMFPRLRERRNQLGGTLSGGEQQMLAIGRGLMFSPKVLMLDEPSLGLAPLVVKEIFELILDIRDRGTTVLLIEQNAGLALQIADRGYVLENGNITLTDTGENLLHNDQVIKAYLGI